MNRGCMLCVIEKEPYYNEIDCILESINVNVKQYLSIVDVRAEFLYTNPSEKLLEADFQFPLENSASIYHFEMQTKDTTLVAECKGRSEATETYDKAKEEGHTAALAYAEDSSPDVFKIKLGNIAPKENIKITLMFTFMAETKVNEVESGKLSREIFFQLPQVLNPRYSPESGGHQIAPHYGPTFVAKKPYTFQFRGELSFDREIKEINSPNLKYKTEYLHEKKTAVVTLAEEFDRKHDIDLHAILAEEEKEASSFSVFFERGSTEKNSFLSKHCIVASFRPPKLDKFKETKNEFIFVIDRSGSMEGANIESARESLLLFLKSLPRESRMQIIGFGSSFSQLFDQPVDLNEENMKKAMEYQKAMNADMGGTEMLGALKHAFESPLSGVGWQKQIILITDGEVWNIAEITALCKENESKGRIFSIGLGEGASTALVTGIAEASNGKARFVRNPSDLRKTVMEIFKMSVQARASDVKIDWKLSGSGKGKFYNIPSQLRCVYADRPLLCYALFDGDVNDLKGTASLSYTMKGEKCELSGPFGPENELKVANEKLPVHRIASKIQLDEMNVKVNSLESAKKDSEEVQALKEEMKLLSIESNVVSSVTAYICVDPKKQESRDKITIFSSPQTHLSNYSSAPMFRGAPMRMNCSAQPHMMSMAPMGRMLQSSVVADSANSDAADCVQMDLYGPSGDYCTEPPAYKKDNFMKLVDENTFYGYWKKNANVLDTIEDILTPGELKEMLDLKKAETPDDVWITVIVLMLFENYFGHLYIEWEIIKEKAVEWITEQGYNFEDLLEVIKKHKKN